MVTHLQLPTPFVIGDSSLRVFFATRNQIGQSHIGSVDLELSSDGSWEADFALDAVLAPGSLGSATEDGVYPSSIISLGDYTYLYYIGWNKGSEYPVFRASIGCLVADTQGRFQPTNSGPILDRGPHDPLFVTAPFVFPNTRGALTMLYVSGLEWRRDSSGSVHSLYDVRLATSKNGFDWRRGGEKALALQSNERNISRVWVNQHPLGGYEAWFSVTKSPDFSYRLAYARSDDGLLWSRFESIPYDLSFEPRLNKVVAYPSVVALGGSRFMFWNGPNFGKEGFFITQLP